MANTHALSLTRASSQYAYKADTASLSITGDISIEMWIKLTQMPSDAGGAFTFAGKYDYGSSLRSYYFDIDNNDKPNFLYSGTDAGTNKTRAFTTDAIADISGVWHHLAVTADVSGKSIKIYLDGSPLGMAAASGTDTSIVDNAAQFSIGANNTGATPENFVDGRIDDPRLWNDVRTEQEINDNMSVELNGDEDNLVSYWKYNDDYTDEHANSNDLTGANSPVFVEDPAFEEAATSGEGTFVAIKVGPGIWTQT